MFDDYKQLSAEKQAEIKAIHKALRAQCGSRYGNLAWGFVRGFPYKRIERKTHEQVMGDGSVVVHNRPIVKMLSHVLGKAIPGFTDVTDKWWETKEHPLIRAWLADPSGAIPAPVLVRKEKPTPEEVGALREGLKVA